MRLRNVLLALIRVVAINAYPTGDQPTGDATPSCTTFYPIVLTYSTVVTVFTPDTTTTVYATTPQDLGTFTLTERVSSTSTLPETLTTTATECAFSGTVTPTVTSTAYVDKNNAVQSALQMQELDEATSSLCSVTSTVTSYYKRTTFVPNGETSTFTQYSQFSLSTKTVTRYSGTTYVVATSYATSSAICGPTATTEPQATTVVRDSRCAPTEMIAEDHGYGLSWISELTTGPGAIYKTTAADATECCQMCVDAYRCANSAWNTRTGQCRLIFMVSQQGAQICDVTKAGLQAYYDYGPLRPMAPGTGWWIGNICGKSYYVPAKPDDGT